MTAEIYGHIHPNVIQWCQCLSLWPIQDLQIIIPNMTFNKSVKLIMSVWSLWIRKKEKVFTNTYAQSNSSCITSCPSDLRFSWTLLGFSSRHVWMKSLKSYPNNSDSQYLRRYPIQTITPVQIRTWRSNDQLATKKRMFNEKHFETIFRYLHWNFCALSWNENSWVQDIFLKSDYLISHKNSFLSKRSSVHYESEHALSKSETISQTRSTEVLVVLTEWVSHRCTRWVPRSSALWSLFLTVSSIDFSRNCLLLWSPTNSVRKWLNIFPDLFPPI